MAPCPSSAVMPSWLVAQPRPEDPVRAFAGAPVVGGAVTVGAVVFRPGGLVVTNEER